MDFAKIVAVGITASVALALSGRPASAQQSDASAGESEFRLAYLQDRAQAGDELSLRDLDFRLTLQDEGGGASPGHTHDYKEISDFFNIREANVNTTKGEWEIEFEAEWVTDSGGGDDDFTFTPNIKYGLTDDMFIELEVLPLNIGDGGDQGNGEAAVVGLFQTVLDDVDCFRRHALEASGLEVVVELLRVVPSGGELRVALAPVLDGGHAAADALDGDVDIAAHAQVAREEPLGLLHVAGAHQTRGHSVPACLRRWQYVLQHAKAPFRPW